MARKRTKEDFLIEAREIHGDKYNYDNVDFTFSNTKVEIVCNKGHGSFWQTPSNHIICKAGCPACGGCERPTTEKFIRQAKEKHGDKYDYSKSVYVKAHQKLLVTCPKEGHGDWEVTPDAHKRGNGCPKCGDERTAASHRLTQEEFIQKATDVHGTKYDYSKVEYKCDTVKVLIGCPEHGDFPCTPSNHKKGRGCPKCAKNGYKRSQPGTFYILTCGNLTKIGITNRKVQDRIRSINKSSGKKFKERFSIFLTDGEVPYQMEQILLQELRSKYKPVDEIFDGSTECFQDVDNALLIVKAVTLFGDQKLLSNENKP
jgi:hypothetical protein